MLKKLLGQLAVAATVALAASAHAAPVTWTLSNVTFEDGGTASGWFVWDAATHTAGAFNFTTTSGSLLDGATYDSTAGGNPQPSTETNGFSWLSGGPLDPYLNLIFASALTDAGGTVALADLDQDHLYGGGFECADSVVCANFRYVASGSATGETAQVVPEPASIALLGAGLVGLGLARRRNAA